MLVLDDLDALLFQRRWRILASQVEDVCLDRCVDLKCSNGEFGVRFNQIQIRSIPRFVELVNDAVDEFSHSLLRNALLLDEIQLHIHSVQNHVYLQTLAASQMCDDRGIL